MICPRCSVAEVSAETNQCILCGFTPTAAVMVDTAAAEELQEIVQRPLAGRFEIQHLIGRGRASFVYAAQEAETNRKVALKIIPLSGPLDADLVRRFDREAARATSLRHSHIVPIFGSGASGSLLWYSMEHVEGRSLAELLRDQGPMDMESCLRMLDQVASALDYAHRRGVVHGNLKPTNILVDEDGWVRVTDFAVMRSFNRPVSAAVGMPPMRTPEYMAPEQFFARGESASADQYAMAVITYECLSGTLPFVGDSFEEVARLHQEESPSRLSDVRDDIPLLIADAVEQAMRKRPTDRFANVLDFVTVLRGGPPQGTEPLAPAAEPRGAPQVLTIQAPRRRWPVLYLMLAALVTAAVVVVLMLAKSAAGPATFDESEFAQATPPDTPPVTVAEPAQPMPATDAGAPTDPSSQQQTDTRPEPVATTPEPAPPRTTTPPPTPRPAARSATITDSARLFVSARPWGALYLDGEFLGNTPKAALGLAPGLHTIRIERDGYEPYEQEIDVGPGEEVRLTDIVLTPRLPE